MRPYLAVIKDSFRAAMATWVLWIMLVLITLVLLSIAPLGYKEKQTVGLLPFEVIDPTGLANRIREQATVEDDATDELALSDEPSPERQIWQRLDEPLRQRVVQLGQPLEIAEDADVQEIQRMLASRQRTVDQLLAEIDRLLGERDFYDERAWQGVELPEEADELLSQQEKLGSLTHEESGRLNRLALDAAFGQFIKASPKTSMQFTYFIWDSGQALPFRKSELSLMVNSSLPWLIDKFILSIGIFVAILVTAPILPQMFEPGSLNLLLSKPVSRWALFLSKFVGGCAFTLLCAVYLFVGLFLILGLRLKIWHVGMLLSIPVYVFVFAIYYVVSSLAALVWRNTIVAVVAAILFWLYCFGLGTTKVWIEGRMDNFRIASLWQADDTLCYLDELNVPHAWDPRQQAWNKTFLTPQQRQMSEVAAVVGSAARLPDMAGPVYDRRRKSLLAVQPTPAGMMMLVVGQGAGGDAAAARPTEWLYLPAAVAHPLTSHLYLEEQGDLIALTRQGEIWRLDGDPTSAIEFIQSLDRQALRNEEVMRSLEEKMPQFVPAGPLPAVTFNVPSAVARNADTGVIALYNRGNITLLAADENGFYTSRDQATTKLEGDEGLSVAMAYGGDTLLVARGNGDIISLGGKTLKARSPYRGEKKSQPRFVVAAPGGRWFAVVYHNRRLWLLDTKTGSMSRAKVKGQGDIAAAYFSGPHRIMVADRTTRVSEYLLDPVRRDRVFDGPMTLFEQVYRYGICWLYAVGPKPGEFYKTVQYLLTEEETVGTQGGQLGTAQRQLRPLAPVWSGLAFIVAMLAIGCLYVERQQF